MFFKKEFHGCAFFLFIKIKKKNKTRHSFFHNVFIMEDEQHQLHMHQLRAQLKINERQLRTNLAMQQRELRQHDIPLVYLLGVCLTMGGYYYAHQDVSVIKTLGIYGLCLWVIALLVWSYSTSQALNDTLRTNKYDLYNTDMIVWFFFLLVPLFFGGSWLCTYFWGLLTGEYNSFG